jgi:hypothetical protein
MAAISADKVVQHRVARAIVATAGVQKDLPTVLHAHMAANQTFFCCLESAVHGKLFEGLRNGDSHGS